MISSSKSLTSSFGFLVHVFTLMQREEGIKLVTEAICSGIFNDLGSGSNVDVCVITKVCCFSSLFTVFNGKRRGY